MSTIFLIFKKNVAVIGYLGGFYDSLDQSGLIYGLKKGVLHAIQ
jgi:hypothetical protein